MTRGGTSDALVAALGAVVGADHVLTDPALRAGYETDWTGRFHGVARCVVRPGGTAEVAGVLAACAGAGASVVPQGGNTGLVGGGVPRGGEVLLSLSRCDDVIPVDVDAAEVVVGAGARLADVQDAARAAGLDFGVDLAARGSATIGGMVATNAGGVHVLRYGSMRDQVLGVEAVLAHGTVVGRLPALRKDNTGYSLAALLCGSEGTLAVVTRVHLRLVPLLADRVVALLAVAGTAEAVTLMGGLRRVLPSLTALELFYEDGMELVRTHRDLPRPFPDAHPAYLLAECAGAAGTGADLMASLAETLADGDVLDSAVGDDPETVARLWAYRDGLTEAVNAVAVPHKLDVTVPVGRLPAFVEEVREVVADTTLGARPVLFGHAGDGNIHVNVLGPSPDDFAVDHAVLRLVAAYGGSVSAEHGIGIAKRDDLGLTRSPADVAVMRAIRTALDPAGILNPGVLFAAASP